MSQTQTQASSPKRYFIRRGTVVWDTDGNDWVHVGFRVTSAGSWCHFFCRVVDRGPPYVWTYSAVHESTLKKKFRGLP